LVSLTVCSACFFGSSTSFWFDPRRRRDFVADQFADTPNMIGQATGHRRSTSFSKVAGFAHFLMGQTEMVRATNQVHPSVQSLQARSRVPTLAGEACQSLADGSIQPFNTGCSEHTSPTRALEQLLCLIEQTVSHVAGDLHDPLVLRSLDHGSNVQVRPHFSGGSTDSCHLLDLLSKGASNAVGIGRPPICQNEHGAQCLGRSAYLLHQRVRKPFVPARTHGPRQPEPRRDHHRCRVANRRGDFAVPFSIGPLQTGRATFIAPSFPASSGYACP